LVTGGGSGIGRATPQLFAREGAKIVVADMQVTDGEETVQLVIAAGGEAIFVKTDVSNPTEVEALIKKTVLAHCRQTFQNAQRVLPRAHLPHLPGRLGGLQNEAPLQPPPLDVANDFPHSDSTRPDSQAVLAKHTTDLTEEEKNWILHDNVAELYQLVL
jgi:NAD(P)-dependent dehydrogenase (short-subunit alcohol dehydrogenase family)